MFNREEKIPEAEEILAENPLPADLKKIKAERDALASAVIRGETDKLLLIVGPCSAHESKKARPRAAHLHEQAAHQGRGL